MLPGLFGFLVLTVPTRYHQRIKEVAQWMRVTTLASETPPKVVADRMDLSESHLSRQLRVGPNAARLVNLGREWWQLGIKGWCELVGLTRDDVLFAFEADPETFDAQREEIERQRDEIERLKRSQKELREDVERLVRHVFPAKSPAREDGQVA